MHRLYNKIMSPHIVKQEIQLRIAVIEKNYVGLNRT